MRSSFRRSKLGISTVVAEVLMVLIVIILSSIVYVWVLPTFTSAEVQGNSGAAYAEKFQTLWGSFATFAPSNPEAVLTCTDFVSYANVPAGMCPVSSPITCTTSITVPTTSNVYVPAGQSCLIKASVGYVFAQTGSNLTVLNTTIKGLIGNSTAIITLTNVNVQGWTDLSNVQTVIITGSSLNTCGCTNVQTDGPDKSAIYHGGRGILTFVNNTVNGQFESEVSHQATVTGNIVNGRLEIESADFGQITNNKVEMLDLDQNGIVVVSGNTVYGNDPNYSGIGILWGNPPNYNRWCAQGNNVVSGSNNNALCVGVIEIDVANTGSIPVNLVAAYMSNIPLAGPVSWKLLSGGASHNSLPITIPVGQSANVTMQWTPPVNVGTLPWTDIYFIFVSSHNNYVDGHIYFGYNPALTVTGQSRPENQVCPPCY